MSLENITKKIEATSKKEADTITEAANKEVSGIKGKEVSEIEKLKKDHGIRIEAIDRELKNSIVLPAKLELRGEKLRARQDVIDKIFSASMKFNNNDYKKILDHYLSQIDVSEGILHPAEGKEQITNEFIKEKKIKVLVGESVSCSGGFIFKKSKTEYDCTFETILKKLREKLQPAIAEETD